MCTDSPFISQTRYPRLWLWMQRMIGGNASKQALALERYRGQRRVLEIGCSVGNISEIFRNYPKINFRGIDIDPNAIRVAKKRFRDVGNFHFSLDSLESLAQTGECFDYVLFAGILHHVDDATAYNLLRDALHCTSHNGYLIIYEPEALRENDTWLFRLFYKLEQGRYLRSKSELVALVQRAGIVLDSVEDRMMSAGILRKPYVARFNLLVSRKTNINN